MGTPIRQGTHADRPAASSANAGQFYFETNTGAEGTMFVSDGTTWNLWDGTPDIAVAISTYSPALQGSTDDAVPTFSAQIGRYYQVGKMCHVSITLVSTSMTKTTLTDNVRVSLPVAAASNTGQVQLLNARCENATAVRNAVLAETVAGAAYVHLREMLPTAATVLMTYALTGLGVLTNTITIQVSGWYETV